MDYAALKAEIGLPAYAGMSHAEIAAALNARTIAARVDVGDADLRDVLLLAGIWGRLALLSRLPPSANALTSPTTQDGIVARVIDLVTIAERGLRLSRAGVRNRFAALLTAMVADGTITASARTDLLAPMAVTISRAEELNLPPVSAGDVATARATIA